MATAKDSAGNDVQVLGLESWLPLNGKAVVLNGTPRVQARKLAGLTGVVLDGPAYIDAADGSGPYAAFLIAVPPDPTKARVVFAATDADFSIPAPGATP